MPLSAILSQALNFFRNNIKSLATLTIPILFVQVGLQLWLSLEIQAADVDNPQFGGSHMAVMFALLLVFSLLIAALTLFLQLRSEGHQATNGQIIKASLNFVPGLLLAGVFSGIAILGPFFILFAFSPVLGMLGLAVSVYLFARLAFVNFMLVVERLTPLDAIKRSFVFSGPLVLKTISILALYIPLSLIGGTLAQLVTSVGFPLQVIIEVAAAFVGLFMNIALFRLYMVYRTEPETNKESDLE